MSELLEGDRLRRKEVRMEEKERDWKRDVRMLGVIIDRAGWPTGRDSSQGRLFVRSQVGSSCESQDDLCRV
jgi:hypothetical protein